MASFPTSVKSFTTKNAGQVIDPAHINDPQDEVTAIETNLLSAAGNGAIYIGSAPPAFSTVVSIPLKLAEAVTASSNVSVGNNLSIGGSCTLAGPLTISGAAAGQIVFPASQNASAGANTLDDYDEGAAPWTPVIGGSGGTSGQTYTYQVGSAIKIGKLVIAQFDVSASNKGTITGNAQIQGLPYTSENTTNQNFVCAVFWNTGAGGTPLVVASGVLAPNSTAMDLYGAGAAVTVQVNLTTAAFDTAIRFAGVIVYRATA